MLWDLVGKPPKFPYSLICSIFDHFFRCCFCSNGAHIKTVFCKYLKLSNNRLKVFKSILWKYEYDWGNIMDIIKIFVSLLGFEQPIFKHFVTHVKIGNFRLMLVASKIHGEKGWYYDIQNFNVSAFTWYKA